MILAGFPPTRVLGGTFLVTTEPAATTEFSPTVTPPMIVAPAAIHGMDRRDDAHVRPDHHIVGNVEAAQIIKSAVQIYENIAPDADVGPTCRVEWRDQQKAVVQLLADEIAEQGPHFVRIAKRQTVQNGCDGRRSFDVCQHGRRFRRSAGNYPGAIVFRHSSSFPERNRANVRMTAAQR
jgi:hypothetical protein